MSFEPSSNNYSVWYGTDVLRHMGGSRWGAAAPMPSPCHSAKDGDLWLNEFVPVPHAHDEMN